MIKKFLVIFFLMSCVFAFDLSDFGDFSSRSVIMNSNQNRITQEQKDLLKEKKLNATTKCLFAEIKKGNTENVKLLLDSKVNPNESYYGEYPIYYASKYNKEDIVYLLYENGAKLNRSFNSELYAAIKKKNTKLAQFFLDKGANVNYTDPVSGNTILSLALKKNMSDIALQLIKKGAYADNKSIKLVKKKKLTKLINNN